MAKDPAFLFYSKDWLEGTAELLPEEKGVYIDLLCYQHQRGFLPFDTQRLSRLVGISLPDFMEIWKTLEPKFNRTVQGLVNGKLGEVMTERAEKGAKNKITGTFAAVLRLANLSKKEYILVKKAFKIEDFTDIPTERLTESLTEWLQSRLKSIEDGNGNEDANEVKGGTGGIVLPFNSEDFKTAWNGWKQYKKDQHNFTYKGAHSEQIALKSLAEKSGNSEQAALKIIQESIANGWQGLFEIKIGNNGKQQQFGQGTDTEQLIQRNKEFLRKSGLIRT